MSNPYSGMTSSTRDTASKSDASLEERIGRQIQPQANGCWLWTGGKSNGYGLHAKARLVHRYVYETLRGPIPDGMVLHHECETKNCCNPAHLTPMEPGDHASHHAQLRNSA